MVCPTSYIHISIFLSMRMELALLETAESCEKLTGSQFMAMHSLRALDLHENKKGSLSMVSRAGRFYSNIIV